MVVAMDQANAIGKNGLLPWRLPADMKHFQESTTGKAVVMGRKTYESIPARFRPLPNRLNMILTHNRSFHAPGCAVLHHDHMVADLSLHQDVCIIGGSEVFKTFLPKADELLVTRVHALIPDTDTFFPEISEMEWQAKFVKRHEADEKNEFCFTIMRYTRIRRR